MTTSAYPEYWERSKSTSSNYNKCILINLNLNGTIAQRICNQFDKTVKEWKIIKIQAVQNQNLWHKYCNEKANLINTNGKNNVNEKYLFHGTRQAIIPTITTQGCRKEYSTTAAYGEGTYFARDASYSVGYSEEINNIRKFMLCKVLCGKIFKGSGSYKLDKWPKQTNALKFDSLVDNLNNPSIFVIHEDYRVYPMYIIHFQRGNSVKYGSKCMDDEKECGVLNDNCSYPKYWKSHLNNDHTQCVFVDMNLNGNEAKNIINILNKSKHRVTKIEGVQNGYLWGRYVKCKANLSMSNNGNVNEKYLFHATTEDVMKTVVTEGFRKEFTHKGRYGKGTYVVRDASRSERYAAKTDKGEYKMFCCKVLCGDMKVGNKDITLRTWPKKSNGLLYDSLVDSTSDPSTYVIHDDARIYPMYIVHFVRQS